MAGRWLLTGLLSLLNPCANSPTRLLSISFSSANYFFDNPPISRTNYDNSSSSYTRDSEITYLFIIYFDWLTDRFTFFIMLWWLFAYWFPFIYWCPFAYPSSSWFTDRYPELDDDSVSKYSKSRLKLFWISDSLSTRVISSVVDSFSLLNMN